MNSKNCKGYFKVQNGSYVIQYSFEIILFTFKTSWEGIVSLGVQKGLYMTQFWLKIILFPFESSLEGIVRIPKVSNVQKMSEYYPNIYKN